MTLISQLLSEASSEAIEKPDDLKGLMREVTLSQDDDGYFVRTHRARSESYRTPHSIPKSAVEFISSTG